MTQEHEFLMPDYYGDFHCKISRCRHACCTGWPVSLSMANYFRLLGLDCDAQMRRRLDCGMHLCDNPTADQYARFSPRWDGNCPMRLDDGRCSIHASLGEEALPDVCRLFPRGIRLTDGYECSCANSCEATLELFLHRRAPIRLIRRTMAFDAPVVETRFTSSAAQVAERTARRADIFRFMEEDDAPLPLTIMTIGQSLREGRLTRFERNGGAATAERLQNGLAVAERMIGIIDETSDSVRAYGEAALAAFADGDPVRKYRDGVLAFESAFPDWEPFFRHALSNHIFFVRFPYRTGRIGDEFGALCSLYMMLRFLCVGNGVTDETALIDVCAALFRLVEHSDFDRGAVHILKLLGVTEPDAMCDLLEL